MLALPILFKGWLIFVPPIDPTKTICLTPAALAVSRKTEMIINTLAINTNRKLKRDEYTNQHLSDSSDQSNQPEKKDIRNKLL